MKPTMLDFRVELIKEESKLARLVERLAIIPVIALDIETVDWWNRHQERIALIQIAYRTGREIKVAVIDALAKLSIEPLRLPLEQTTTLKVIHNAVFDASRLAAHFKFQVAPIHDTMIAARLNKEKRYSLQAQAFAHLGLHLDKGAQRSDWSRRPLTPQQIHYAALDAAATLRLFEHQAERNLHGNYRFKANPSSQQAPLPLNLDSAPPPATPSAPNAITARVQNSRDATAAEENNVPITDDSFSSNLSVASLALLGIIAELPTRYSPGQLAVSVGTERVGLAGWIIDRTLGADTDFGEETAKLAIIELCERKLVSVTLTGRLEATTDGAGLWQNLKTI